jgi:hypothetical protein
MLSRKEVSSVLKYPAKYLLTRSARAFGTKGEFAKPRVSLPYPTQLWTVFGRPFKAAHTNERAEVFACEITCEMHVAQLLI